MQNGVMSMEVIETICESCSEFKDCTLTLYDMWVCRDCRDNILIPLSHKLVKDIG